MAAPRFLADEDFRFDMVLAVRARDASIDIVTVQELALGGMDDADLLDRAQQAGRIVLSHDRNTMTAEAACRLQADRSIAGLIIVPQHARRADVAENLAMITKCSDAAEWVNVVDYVPW